MRVTILIPTFNEEQALPATLASLRAMDPQPDEVLLVDGGSTDATLLIAREASISYPSGEGRMMLAGA